MGCVESVRCKKMTKTFDIHDPAINEAVDMAIELVRHCEEHDLDPTIVMADVAWNFDAVVEQRMRRAFRRIMEAE